MVGVLGQNPDPSPPPTWEVRPVRRGSARHLIHEPRRLLLTPWRRECWCGLGAWPCPALAMLQRQAAVALDRQRARSTWHAPTGRLPVAPLLTRGQAFRTRGSTRW